MSVRQFLSRSRIGFGIVLLLGVIALCAMPTTVALADDTAAVAQVLVIVVEADGDWMITDKSEAPQVTITRAPGGCSATSVVRKGVPLCKGDHVITGTGVKVKIAFGDPKDREELTIGPSSDVKISSANCGFICRWFGSWKNSYTNRTPHTSYTNEGTVYEVSAQSDGSGELIVYQGLVHAKKSDDGPDTAGVLETSKAATDQPLADSGSVPVEGLQRVTIASDGTPGAPVSLTYDELREALAFSSDVEIASHNNPAEAGDTFAKFVNFQTIAVRNRVFRKARVDSFWRPKEFRSFLELAKVYNDWGDAEQALTYLSKATELFPALAIPELWLNKAIALRQIGETQLASDELDRVISNATDSTYAGDALNIRGTIFSDRARKLMIASQTEEATAEADSLLQQASQEYLNAGSKRPTQPQYLAVNQAQVFKAQGDIFKRRAQYDQAALMYIAAIASLGAAYGDVDNPKNKVAGYLVARAQAALADAYAAMGQSVKSFETYQKAENTYKASIAEAERQNQKFAQSYCGLASMYLILGDNKARENYDKCVAYNIAALVTEAEVPKVLSLRRPNAIQLLAEAGLEPEIVTDGETVVAQEPLMGKIKIGTKVKLTLTIEGRQ